LFGSIFASAAMGSSSGLSLLRIWGETDGRCREAEDPEPDASSIISDRTRFRG